MRLPTRILYPLWDRRAVRGSGPPNQHWLVGARSDPTQARAARQKDTGLTSQGLCGDIKGRAAALPLVGSLSPGAYCTPKLTFRVSVAPLVLSVILISSRYAPSGNVRSETA